MCYRAVCCRTTAQRPILMHMQSLPTPCEVLYQGRLDAPEVSCTVCLAKTHDLYSARRCLLTGAIDKRGDSAVYSNYKITMLQLHKLCRMWWL